MILSGCSWARVFSDANPFTTTARTHALGDSQLEGLLPQSKESHKVVWEAFSHPSCSDYSGGLGADKGLIKHHQASTTSSCCSKGLIQRDDSSTWEMH